MCMCVSVEKCEIRVIFEGGKYLERDKISTRKKKKKK